MLQKSYACVSVNVEGGAYDILIGQGIVMTCGDVLKQTFAAGTRIMLVTDSNVAGVHLEKVQNSLRAAGFECLAPLIIPAGEKSKSWAQAGTALEHILAQRPDRHTVLIALGGGVIGDLTGFIASILLRGVAFVQIPTTLMAQVDSSVGGKTAVNSPSGKNLIGSFYQPKSVLIDTDMLNSLSDRDFRAGYAEVLKYGLINDRVFFEWLEKNMDSVMRRDPAALVHAVKSSCLSKAAIVTVDEKEKNGLRALLNLGHTFGHALEAIGGYDNRLLHGEAVAIGLHMAAAFSEHMKLAPEGTAAQIAAHLTRAGLPLRPPFAVDPNRLLELMRGDKKASGGRIVLILMRGIGKAFTETNVDEAQLIRYLEDWAAA